VPILRFNALAHNAGAREVIRGDYNMRMVIIL
jgi:hypothetical protein